MCVWGGGGGVVTSYPGFYRLQYENRANDKSLGRPGYEAKGTAH